MLVRHERRWYGKTVAVVIPCPRGEQVPRRETGSEGERPMSKMIAEPALAAEAVARPVAVLPAVADSDSPQTIRRLVVRLAWPTIQENMFQSIFNILLIKMVAELGSAAIAGVGASNSLNQ